MTLGPKMVYLIRPNIVDQLNDLPRIREITVMQEKACAGIVGVRINVIDPPSIEGAGAADKPMHIIPLPRRNSAR